MARRHVEVFTAGCPVCDPAVHLVQEMACPDCEVTVYDLREQAADLARGYGVHRVPAVVVDGRLVACCDGPPVDAGTLRSAGIGQPLS